MDDHEILVGIAENVGGLKTSVDGINKRLDVVCDAVKKNTRFRHMTKGAIAMISAAVGYAIYWIRYK